MTIGRTHRFQVINRARGAFLCSIDHECGRDCVGDTKQIVTSQEISGLDITKICGAAWRNLNFPNKQ